MTLREKEKAAVQAATVAACAAIARKFTSGQAFEDNGETFLLGSMMLNPVEAQRATAETIAVAIESLAPSTGVLVPRGVVQFAADCFSEHRDELGDIDGGWLQDKLVECGLLHKVTATEACGECCRCADYGEFPQECMRDTDAAKFLLAAAGEKS